MTMITPSYLGETIEYSSLHACRSTLEDPTPGMTMTPEVAARRYLQASEFGTDVSGQFFASAPKKLTGPIEAMRHPHLHDRANQEAAWQAVVKVSGVDYVSSAAPLSAMS